MGFPVKGIYVSWSNDPPNTKITNWNVTELKVSIFLLIFMSSINCVTGIISSRSILIDVTLINQLLLVFGGYWIRGCKSINLG